jgi:hypothetical protein
MEEWRSLAMMLKTVPANLRALMTSDLNHHFSDKAAGDDRVEGQRTPP